MVTQNIQNTTPKKHPYQRHSEVKRRGPLRKVDTKESVPLGYRILKSHHKIPGRIC